MQIFFMSENYFLNYIKINYEAINAMPTIKNNKPTIL